MINAEIETNFGTVFGSYEGGSYIQLSFGVADSPIEVINVYDYEKSVPKISPTHEAVHEVMTEWLKEQSDYNLQQFFHRQSMA